MIRPLVYVRERDLNSFAKQVRLPVIPENCPACFAAPKVTIAMCLLHCCDQLYIGKRKGQTVTSSTGDIVPKIICEFVNSNETIDGEGIEE